MDSFTPIFAVLLSASFWFWLIRKKDVFSPEPFWFLLMVAVLGGILSVIPSGSLNSAVVGSDPTSLVTLIMKMGFVGLNEELWKMLATYFLVMNSKHFNEPIDGIIFAATVALGFAAIENLEYISRYGLGVLLTRHYLSVPGHIAFAMIWGYGLTLAKFKYPERNVFLVVLPYYLLAALIHASYNVSVTYFSGGWSLITGGLLVVVLYRYSSMKSDKLLLASSTRPIEYCPICKVDNKENSHSCASCGGQLNSNEDFPLLSRISCNGCSTSNRSNAQFCIECGDAFSTQNKDVIK